ncbi:hypothetical protein, partial [Escherichia fergusonii]|uniref:hypothetical protein n=1 Tax=Escherichia fergusonii TaxID=564 RepID=UPI001CBF5440
GEKRVFLVILFTSFSGSLVSRISGAVQTFLSVLPCESLKTYWLIGVEEGSKIEAVSFTVGSG